MKRYRFLTVVLAGILLTLVSCGDKKKTGGGEGTPGESKGTIGMTCMDLNNPFFQFISKVMEEKASAAGYTLKTMSGDAAMQNTQINDFISQGCVAIFLNPADSKASAEGVRQAAKKGVPVFTFDVQMEDPEVADLVTFHVGSDNYQGGRLAGESMLKLTGNKGRIGVINKLDSNSCVLRVKGFKDYLKEHGSELEIVSELDGKGKREAGYTVATDMLQANRDIVAIFAINDPCGLGAYQAVEEANLTDQVTIIGFDGSPDGKTGVYEKKLYDTPQQFPRQMAEMTVETFLKHVQGETFEKTVIIPCRHYYYEDAVKDGKRDKF